mgnify:CR=1 FL=1
MLGCADCGPLETPAYDRLAADCIRFSQATWATSPCPPRRHNTLTGLHAFRTGVRTNGSFLRPEREPELYNIAEDPPEHVNPADDSARAPVLAELREKLLDELARVCALDRGEYPTSSKEGPITKERRGGLWTLDVPCSLFVYEK